MKDSHDWSFIHPALVRIITGGMLALLMFAATACQALPQEFGVDPSPAPTVTKQQVSKTGTDVEPESVMAPTVEVSLESTLETAQMVTPESAPSAVDLQATLTELYREVNGSVVYIVVSSTFDSEMIRIGGSGSGFVYSADGYIVTNHHVVEAGSTYEVVFSGGDRRRGELIGSDPDSDLAVLQVESLPEGVIRLPQADSNTLEVGQFAVAIGSPFGEQGSMSLGIISGLDRSLPSQRSLDSTGTTYSLPQVIQTDAPINPGNSGGPLLNLEGEVIGVNAAIASMTGTNSGVGFSIPVNVLQRVVPSLISEGSVAYPYMGVVFDNEVSLDDQIAYGLPQTQGAYVIGVTPGGPGDNAGLIAADANTGEGGDLIIRIDETSINNFADLNTYLVLEARVGDTITVTVLRDGSEVDLSLTLGARP